MNERKGGIDVGMKTHTRTNLCMHVLSNSDNPYICIFIALYTKHNSHFNTVAMLSELHR